jgi:hypothetical protein
MSYKGGAQSTTKHLHYAPNFYTPHAILEAEVMTEAEARREYSRLRSIARKRLERFEGTEWTDTDVYKYNKDRYKPISEMRNYSELAHLLGDVARFLSNDSHPNSVSELESRRAQTIRTLHENGYTFVNKKNYNEYTDFMEAVRAQKMHVRGSPEAELFAAAKKKGIDPEKLEKELNWWLDNRRYLEAMPKIKNDKPHSAEDYKKAILDIKETKRKHDEKQAQKKTRKK